MRCFLGIFVVMLLGTAAQAEPKVNVLGNGGFEEGLTGWTPDPQQVLLRDPQAAHGGKACLSGEVQAPNKGLILKRRVPVEASNRYEFEIWARGTNQTKLVLWAVLPGKAERKSVAAWDQVGSTWQRYSTSIDVVAEGTLELQLIAPSSHNASPGKIWIDDIALSTTSKPLTASVSDSVGYNDESAMAQAQDGSLYVAWGSFRDGADTLQIARYSFDGRGFKKLGSWQALGGKDTYILGLKAVAAGNNAYILYAAEVHKNWDVYALPCSPEGPGRPVRITTAPAADIKPAGAWRDGALWVAWESNGGGWHQVFAAALPDGKISQPELLSHATSSNYDPTLACLPNGEVLVAWHSFRDNNYDIYLRRRNGSGTWEPERRLTQAPSIDRHPLLLSRDNDAWLIYENALMGSPKGFENVEGQRAYGIGATRTRRLVVAKLSAEGLLGPKDYATASPVFKQKSEAPAAVFDRAGRLWLLCRATSEPVGPKAKSRNWNVAMTCFDGQKWSPCSVISHRGGMDRYPSVALVGEHLVAAYQADAGLGPFNSEELSKDSTSDIYLTSAKCGPSANTPAMALEPLVEPDDAFAPGQIRVARGEDRPTPSIEYQGRKFHLYFGDLHDHTEISICNRTSDESVDESYANMRDITRCDFACATDHGYNINPYYWCYLAKLARVNDDSPRFLSFLAEEWTSTFEEYDAKHPFGFYGHRNLIFADAYFPRWWNARTRQTPAQVWEDLRKLKANFVHIPHQLADTGNVPTDWDFTDEEAQPVAEIFQARGSYEYKGAPREAARTTPGPGYFLQDAWARGIVIGVIAAPDHGGGYGKACVYAPELSRTAILDALRARRCYGTTAAKIFLEVRVDGHFMGEKIAQPAGSTVAVETRVDCPGEIDRVEVCRNNQFIYMKNNPGVKCQLTFVDRQPLPGRSYYYVRVMQKDGEIAWSSPVWFGAP